MKTRIRYDEGIVACTEPENPHADQTTRPPPVRSGRSLLFLQTALPRNDASVEHLQAIANGGANGDENCVACCKTVNALLGSMSIKQKFEVVLNQQGQFRCPNEPVRPPPEPAVTPAPSPREHPPVAASSPSASAAPPKAAKVVASKTVNRFALVTENLKTRGNSRPRTLKTLTSSIAALFPKGISQKEIESIVRHLQASGKVRLEGAKIVYKL